MKDFKEKVEKIKDKVSEKTLWMGRVPQKTKKKFIELAKEDFEGDYGMTLKNLMDIHDGFIPSGHEEIEEKLDVLAEQIVELNKRLLKIEEIPKKRIIKSVSGRKIIEKED